MKGEKYSGTHIQPAVKPSKKERKPLPEREARAPRKRDAADPGPEGKTPQGPRADAAPRREKKGRAAPPRRPLSRPRLFLLLAILAALLVLAAALLLGTSGGKERKRYMNEAAARFQAGDYDSALSSLRRARRIESDPECLMLMADCYEAQGNLDKALETLRQMDVNDPRVSTRISQLEERRRAAREAEMLSVAGQKFAPDSRSLVLDGLGLESDSLREVAQLYALDSLSMMNNALTDLSALSALGGLDTLNLAGNAITDLRPLASLTELRTLYLDDNPITDLTPLYALKNLNTLGITGIPLSSGQLDALAKALPGCAIRSDAPESEAQDITLGGVTFKSDVRELKLAGLEIHDLSALSGCTELRSLDLSGNEVGDLQPLMNLPHLEKLNVSGNQVTDLLPLIGLASLRSLDASDNLITDTAAAGAMTNLSALDLSGNPLRDFSGLAKLKNLRSLRLIGTGVEDADLGALQGLAKLTNLFLDENGEISNEAMGELQSALPDCAISYTELVYTAQIAGLSLRSDLTELDLSARELTDLTGLDQMRCLETLRLCKNGLSNLAPLQNSPSRDTLKTLDLSANEISDLTPLGCLTAIETLDLRANQVTDLTALRQLGTLRQLYLGGNPLDPEALDALRAALPDCEIVVD